MKDKSCKLQRKYIEVTIQSCELILKSVKTLLLVDFTKATEDLR